MSELQLLCDDAFQLSNSVVDMSRSLVAETHRQSVPLSELRRHWQDQIVRFAANIERTETLWRGCRDTWAGGQSTIAPETLAIAFDELNTLLSSYEVTFWSMDKILATTDEVLPHATHTLRQHCEWVLSHHGVIEKLRSQVSEMRTEFDSVIRQISREVAERGITELDLFREEMDARVKLATMNPSIQEWDDISSRSGAPEYMKDEAGGPCPF